jgi:hypothetical protein
VAALVGEGPGNLDVLDNVNEKLWIRFLGGTSYMFGATPIAFLMWTPWGALLTCQGTVGGTGGSFKGVWFGADTRTVWGTGGYAEFKGFIESRNSALGDNATNSGAPIPGDSCLWCDYLGPDDMPHGTSYYFAVATNNGMCCLKLTAFHSTTSPTEYSHSTETTEMRWCVFDQSTGELFYMDASKMYSVAQSGAGGWEFVMTGGTFSAQQDKFLPGTRVVDMQYTAVKYGTYLFVPAVEGVYRVNWPSGSWELFYGAERSGATHEILHPNQWVNTIALGNEGTEDLLAVALANEHVGQVMLIKLSDNTVYGLTKIEDLKISNALAAAV